MYLDLDHALFKIINGLAGRWILLDGLGIFFANYLIIGLGLFLLHLWFFKKINSRAVFSIFISVAIVLLLNKLISVFYFRFRPFIAYPGVYQLVSQSLGNKSFPSDHTAVAFALATSSLFFNKRWGKWFLAGAFLIGLSRIFSGVHYPLDVVVGALLGAGTAVMIKWTIIGHST